MTKRPAVVLGVLMLVLAGCGQSARNAPERPVAAPARTLVIAASALETAASDPRMGLETVTRVWLISTTSDATTMLPVPARSDLLPRLSPDRTRMLYASAIVEPISRRRGDVFGQLRIHDLRSHADTVTLEAPILAFGWSAAGEPIALSTEETEVAGQPRNVPALSIFGPHGWTKLSLGSTGPPRWGRAQFLAADSEAVYLANTEIRYMFGPDPEHVWRIDRRTGDIRRLSPDVMRGDRLPQVSADAPRHGSQILLDGGLPVEWTIIRPTAGPGASTLVETVEFHRPSDWSLLRSVTLTPPAAVRGENVLVFDGGFSRYLLSTRTEHAGILAIWESSADSTRTARVIAGTTETPNPVPLGYAADDIIYRTTQDGRGVVRLFDRRTGTSRTLAAIGGAFGERRSEPVVELLGVIEEGSR